MNARACFSADRYRFSALLFYNALTDKSRFSAGCHRRVRVYICVFVELCLRKKKTYTGGGRSIFDSGGGDGGIVPACADAVTFFFERI